MFLTDQNTQLKKEMETIKEELIDAQKVRDEIAKVSNAIHSSCYIKPINC